MDIFPGYFLIVIFASICVLLTRYYYNFFWARSKLKNIQHVKQYPLLGSLLSFPDSLALYHNLANFPKKYGKSYWLMLGSIPVLCTSDPNLLEIVLSSSKHIKKSSFYTVVKPLGGDGLLTSNGDSWRSQRKLLTPTFHFKILEQFVKIFNRKSDEFIRELEAEVTKDQIDLPSLTSQWALNQLLETVMGLKTNEKEGNSKIYHDVSKKALLIATQRIIRPLEYFDFTFFFTKNYRNQRKYFKILDDYVLGAIRKKTLQMKNTNGSKQIDGGKQKIVSLDLLMELAGLELNEIMLKDHVHTLMFAGHDTTSGSTTFALYNLAEEPEIQNKVFKEVKEVMGNDPHKEVTLSLLQKMNYLEMFIKESMRKYSYIPVIGRELGEDVQWGRITLPKGLQITPSITGLHMDPNIYPDPEKLDPERFSSENCLKRHPYSFIPFSAGPRNCIGQKYAMYAMKTGLAKLILSYEFISVKHELELSAELTLVSKSGVKVAIKKREKLF